SIGGFTVNPNDAPVTTSVPGGATNPGSVVGFRFDGEVTTIGTNDWASDMRMVITSPAGPTYSVGGLGAGIVNEWDFQGGGSTNAGSYSSLHDDAFAPGTEDAGTWGFSFEHNWDDGTDMTWAGVEVTLLKQPCESVQDISWLSTDTTSGTIAPGGDSTIQVQVDATGLSEGDYSAQICVNSNATNASIVAVPVSLEVTGTPDPATLNGNVRSLGYCQGNPDSFAGVEVTITGQNNTLTTTTDAAGDYSIGVAVSEGPVNIGVDHVNHLPVSVTGVALSPGQTITNDMEMILAEPCAVVDDSVMNMTLGPNETNSLSLDIGNADGGATLGWSISLAQSPQGCLSRGTSVGDWLAAVPSSGTAGIGGTDIVSMEFNSNVATTGTYQGYACVFTSDDSNNPLTVIEVNLEVLSVSNEIFDDRFEEISPNR
ncbi:MAG: carboxypeptidase-like regulatory domain-containing protein, partial [Pseudomonadota bacterium]